jgi:anti-sigma B factor antagonist
MGSSQPQTRTAVVPLPAEIDITNALQLGSDLLAAFVPGVTAVIADMTATTFCDSSGVSILALARRQAMVNQAKLVLVVPSAAVLRVLMVTGVDVLLPIYPSLAEALSAESMPEAGATR